MADELCGAWGGCTLPAGHNMGNADIPANHRVPTRADEKLTPERAVRLLRAKAGELERTTKVFYDAGGTATNEMIGNLAADIALIAALLADHIERQDSTLALYVAHLANLIERVYALEGGDPDLTTVTVQHDASFNEPKAESPISEWHAGDPPGPGEPGDASDAT